MLNWSCFGCFPRNTCLAIILILQLQNVVCGNDPISMLLTELDEVDSNVNDFWNEDLN